MLTLLNNTGLLNTKLLLTALIIFQWTGAAVSHSKSGGHKGKQKSQAV